MRRNLLQAIRRTEVAATPKILPLAAYRNFLILEHSLALGTAIHGTPLLAVLRAAIPNARLIAAASGFGWGVLQGNPHLETLLQVPSPFVDLAGSVRALRQARPFGGEPYAVLHTTGNGRTRVVLQAMLSGGHVRVGFCVHPELMVAPLRFDHAQSQIANNLRIVKALGHTEASAQALSETPDLAEPALYPSAGDGQHVASLLQPLAGSGSGEFAVLVTQTSPTQRKSWRSERFQAVATWLWERYGMPVVLVGTAPEWQAIESLRSGLRTPSLNLAGKTTLGQMAALFERAQLAVSLDTGPMHIARAMQTPLVVIAPAWSPPLEWLPVDNSRARVLKELDLPAAPAEYIIDEVEVKHVTVAVTGLLTKEPL